MLDQSLEVEYPAKRRKITELNDHGSEFEPLQSLMDKYSDSLEEQVDEDRFLPDSLTVADLALEIGLIVMENSGENAIDLRNRILMENGEKEKLKKSLIEEMDSERDTYNFRNLEDLEAEKVLEIYNILNRCRD